MAPILPIVMGLSQVAPIIARWLGGENAGQVAEKVVGIAQVVTGAVTPEEALQKIQADAKLVSDFQIAVMQNATELERLYLANDIADRTQASADIMTVNATMQAEGKSEHWAQWGWRPYWGFASGTAFAFVCGLVCYLGYEAVLSRDQNALRMIPDLVGAFAMLFSVPGAILGVASWHRGKQKRIAAGEG